MIGVRLFGRGSGAFRTDFARWLIVIAAVLAACALPARQKASAAAKPDPSADPFLAEDVEPPKGDEIPPVPDAPAKPKPRKSFGDGDATPPDKPKSADKQKAPRETSRDKTNRDKTNRGETKTDVSSGAPAVPKLEAPRLPREIKKTQPPRLDSLDDPELSLPETPHSKVELPAAKHQPLEPSAGWKSAVPGAPKTVRKAGAAAPGDPESARFEKEQGIDLATLDQPLAAIVVEGNKTIKTEEIRKLIKTRPGRVAERKQIREDVDTLTRRRWFYSVEPRIAQSAEGPVLVFRVVERPVLQKVTYVGNKKIKEKELAELTGLKTGGPYDLSINREAAKRIESHYQEKGYLHAKVTLEKGASPTEREVVFKIEEGPKVVVSKISFSGNSFVSGAVLKTQVKTKTQILWLFGGKYDPVTIPEDVQALKQYYHNLGFFDVKVKANEGTSEDKAKVHIEYVIDEGARYKVRNIEFDGNRVISKEKLLENMRMKPNEFYNERFVTADKEKIVAQYGELGRILAQVQPNPITHETPGFVDVVYRINEDRPYRIGRIRVKINGSHPHTKESVVLRTLLFKPGDLANKAKIDQSEQRLKNTGVFAGGMPGQNQQGAAPPHIDIAISDIKIARREPNVLRGQDAPEASAPPSRPKPAPRAARPLPLDDEPLFEPEIFRGQSFSPDPSGGDSVFDEPVVGEPPAIGFDEPPGYIDTTIDVSETQTGRINFGVGVNSNMGFLGNIVLEENNFDLFRPPQSFQDVLDGTAFRGGGQQFRIEAYPGIQLSRYVASWRDPYFLDQNVSLSVSGSYYTRFQPNWLEQRAGGRVSVGRQFTPYWSGNIAFSAEDVQISSPSFPTPPEVASLVGTSFLSTVTASVAHDTRDSPFLPGKGHYIDVNYQQGIADFVFPKVFADAKKYFLVRERPDGGSRHVISLSGTVGWTGNQTPFYERFYAGGFQNFRGFQYYGVTPRVDDFRVGGNFEFLGSAEYLLPVTADNTIQIVTFTDFGTVDRDVTLDAFRVSVGAGFRVLVPMMGPVPLAVDFAVPLRRQSFDTDQLVSFWFGLLR